jgi:hypothetical protein
MSVCGAHSGCKLGVSGAGFYSSLTRGRSERSRSDEELRVKVRVSFVANDRSYDAGRVWHDLIADGPACGLHRIERLTRGCKGSGQKQAALCRDLDCAPPVAKFLTAKNGATLGASRIEPPPSHQPSRPLLARIRPGSPAPAIGPGTPAMRSPIRAISAVGLATPTTLPARWSYCFRKTCHRQRAGQCRW